MSDQWSAVVRREQQQREEQIANDKYHATQETYRLEQDRAHEGKFVGDGTAQPGLLAGLKQALRRLLRRS